MSTIENKDERVIKYLKILSVIDKEFKLIRAKLLLFCFKSEFAHLADF